MADENVFSDLERMIHGAGGLVRVSADLRPRTLEAARAERREKTARHRIERCAMVVMLLGMAIWQLRAHLPMDSPLNAEVRVDSRKVFAVAERQARDGAAGGFDWSVVDAFCRLREQQSDAIRRAF